jgi:hypothetical protein
MHRNFLTIFVLLLMAGCASTNPPIVPPVSQSATVQINQGYDSIPNYGRVYFQGGQQVAKASIDRWTTYCRLHVYNPDMKADYITAVAPGRFEVTRVRNRLEVTQNPFSDPDFHASPRPGFSAIKARWGSIWPRESLASYYLYRVNMKLLSADQPDVQSLVCTKKWSAYGNHFPTLDEIRLALGDLIEITPPSVSNLESDVVTSSGSI